MKTAKSSKKTEGITVAKSLTHTSKFLTLYGFGGSFDLPADPDNCIIRKDKEIKQRETNLLIAR